MVKKIFYAAVLATLLTGCVSNNEVWAPQSLAPANQEDYNESLQWGAPNPRWYKDIYIDGRWPDAKYQDFLKAKSFSEICRDVITHDTPYITKISYDKQMRVDGKHTETEMSYNQCNPDKIIDPKLKKEITIRTQDYAINRSNYNCAVYLKRIYSSQVNSDFSLNSTSLITSTLATVLTPPSVKAGLSAASAILTGVQGSKDQSLLQSKVITLILKQIYIMQKEKYQQIQESRNNIETFNWQKAELDAGDYDRLCGIFPALSALEDNVNNATTINRYATILSKYVTERDKLQKELDGLNSKLINSTLTDAQRKEVEKQRDEKKIKINMLDGKINALSVPASYAKTTDSLVNKENEDAAKKDEKNIIDQKLVSLEDQLSSEKAILNDMEKELAHNQSDEVLKQKIQLKKEEIKRIEDDVVRYKKYSEIVKNAANERLHD